jgi:hypothetical protein
VKEEAKDEEEKEEVEKVYFTRKIHLLVQSFLRF